jgi:hypothetical protein
VKRSNDLTQQRTAYRRAIVAAAEAGEEPTQALYDAAAKCYRSPMQVDADYATARLRHEIAAKLADERAKPQQLKARVAAIDEKLLQLKQQREHIDRQRCGLGDERDVIMAEILNRQSGLAGHINRFTKIMRETSSGDVPHEDPINFRLAE